MMMLGHIAETRYAAMAPVLCVVLFVVAYVQSQGRHIGDLKPGVSESHADSRYTRDAASIVTNYGDGPGCGFFVFLNV